MPGELDLTFDDGPDPTWTRRVIDALARDDVRATFFMVGERVRAHPETARAVLEAGHAVELHCDAHVRHSELSESALELDTRRGLQALHAIGASPSRWRSPWGAWTDASSRVAQRHGLEHVHWTIDTHDWRGDDAEAMLAAARPWIRAGAVVLMHDAIGPGARREGCANTVELIPELVREAHSAGLRAARAEVSP